MIIHRTQESDLQISTTLLGPIALLSSHLAYLNNVLPSGAVASVYRSVASRLATHLLQRQVLYRGRGRISPDEGKRIAAEAELWVQTCRTALARAPSARVEAPWRRFLQAARILGADDGVWRKIVLVTLGGHDDDKWAEAMKESVGVSELEREEVTNVIKARADGDNVI
jgi:RAD50-interacting protein 1